MQAPEELSKILADADELGGLDLRHADSAPPGGLPLLPPASTPLPAVSAGLALAVAEVAGVESCLQTGRVMN